MILVGVAAFAIGLTSPGLDVLGPFVAFLTLLVAIGVLYALSRPPAGPLPSWTRDGGLLDRAPERSPEPATVSGTGFVAVVEEAAVRAREERTVEAGFDVLRPHLRETLRGVLAQAHADPDAVESVIANGTWTADPTVAAILAPDLERPDWPLRKRVLAWLFPERVLRATSRTAVQAIADVAGETLPEIPGQRVARTHRRLEPTLAELQRGVDGELQRALDPLDTSPSQLSGDDPVGDPTLTQPGDPAEGASADSAGSHPSTDWAQPTLDGQLRESQDPTQESDRP
jgi:hypothetical protein